MNLPTGGAQLAIPLTEVQSGALRIPVSLAYSFTGLQVYQPRELVGLGWALQADTDISLQVMGLLDGLAVGPNNRYNPDTITASSQAYLNHAGRNIADTGPDIYSFSLPGGPSGKFLLRDTTVVLLPQQPLHVRFIRGINVGFQITTEDGQRYQFLAVERTHSGGLFGLGTYASAWHLTRIISASNADTIRFCYSSSTSPEPTPKRIAVTTGSYSVGFSGGSGPGESACAQASTYRWTNIVTADTRLAPQFLDSITTRGTHVVFQRDQGNRVLRGVRVLSVIGERREQRRFTLFQSYFDGNNSADLHLRLDSVQEQAYALRLPPYRLHYLPDMLPPRSSAAVDSWGYYNGASRNGDASNPSTPALLTDPKLGASLVADRTPQFGYAVAGALQRVTYPTGGRSEWAYEANRIDYGKPLPPTAIRDTMRVEVHQAYDAAHHTTSPSGSKQVTYSSVATFQLPDNGTLVVDLTRTVQNGDPLYKSRYQDFHLWRHLPNGDTLLLTSSAYPVQDYSVEYQQAKRQLRFVAPAGQYSLQLYCEDNEDLLAEVAVPFTRVPASSGITGVPGPGVRVWRTRTTAPGAPPICQFYDYLVADSARAYGSGTLLSGGGGFAYQQFRNVYDNCNTCQLVQTSSDNPLPGDQWNRYPFYYNCVTVRDSLLRGATTSYFTNLDTQFNEVVLISEQTFRHRPQVPGQLQLVQETEYGYTPDSVSSYPFIRVYQDRYNRLIGIHYCPPDQADDRWAAMEQPGVLVSAAALLRFTRQTQYDDKGMRTTTCTRSDYRRQRLVRTSTRTSTNWLIQRYKRLSDYDPTVAVRALQVQHFNPVIETQTWQRPLTGQDSTLVAGRITLYESRWRSPKRSYQLRLAQPLPGLNQESLRNGRYANLLSDSRYELVASVRYATDSDDLLEQQPNHGVPTAYVSGYDHTLTIAQVQQATYDQVAYTSFEPLAPGRWRYDSTGTHRQPGGRTGRWAYRLDGGPGVARAGLPAGEYELTYWAQGAVGPQLLLSGGSQAGTGPVQLATVGDWHQYRVHLHFTAMGEVTLQAPGGASVLVDEVRLYPVGGRMTSYTHDPLVGMTSQTGPDGRTQTYEYDGLGRLVRTRDEQGRILGQQQYHYAGQ